MRAERGSGLSLRYLSLFSGIEAASAAWHTQRDTWTVIARSTKRSSELRDDNHAWGLVRSVSQESEGDVTRAVAFAENSRNEIRLEGGDGQRTGALSTGGGKPGQGVPMIAFPANLSGTQCASTENVAPALGAVNPTAVAFSCKDYGADAANDIAPTMRSMGHAGSHQIGRAHV